MLCPKTRDYAARALGYSEITDLALRAAAKQVRFSYAVALKFYGAGGGKQPLEWIGEEGQVQELSLPDPAMPHDERFAKEKFARERLAHILRLLKQVTKTERHVFIFVERFGLDGDEPVARAELATKYGVSPTAVDLAIRKTIKRMQAIDPSLCLVRPPTGRGRKRSI